MTQKGRLADSVAEIEKIAEAITAGNGAKAEVACRTHIEKAAEGALAVLAHDEPRKPRRARRVPAND